VDHEELQGQKHDIGVIIHTGLMVCSSGEHIRFAHRFARSVMKEEIKVGEVK
jgi:hypothetical protein